MSYTRLFEQARSILSSQTKRLGIPDRMRTVGERLKAVAAPLVVVSAPLKATIMAAPRQELEQAGLRVGIVAAILGYLLWHVMDDGTIAASEFEVLAVTILFLLFGVALVWQILSNPETSVRRRLLGMFGDNAVASYFLFQMGEPGAVILGVYLFITMGNGFRFGRSYLYVCQIMGLVGFSIVLWVSPFWSQHLRIGVGFLIALGIVPYYVGMFAERIKKERKRADDANQAKGRFLATVSHEMRTPLNGVIAMADVLRETKLNESQKEIVETLGTSAQLLLAQIEDVLDMAKIEAGRVQIEKRPFDLGKLLTSTVKVVMPQARYKGLAIHTHVAPEAARWFEGDPHHLRQVLLNLLANAVKFTERGEITLRVAPVESTEVNSRIRFEVRDTGIGISPEKQAVIFEPFTQADDSITRVYGGTGLGTTIARQLVLLMGGKIGLASALGVGSTFWLELPLPFAEPTGIDLTAEVGLADHLSSASVALAAQQPKVTKIRGARVLVAEDNATNQRVTQLILESGGHSATIVDNGEAALDALERGSFDLALFDLSMPVVSGLEALKLYHFATPKPIPVLILSANVTTEIIADCQRAGCAEFVPKPVRPTMLLDAIERHLAAAAQEFVPNTPPPRSEERPSLTVVGTPVVDKIVLLDLDRLSTDPSFVERLVRGFKSDAERLVKSMSDALAARRYEEVKEIAHALKGGAGSVGATQLVRMAVRFETASHDMLRHKAAIWMEELAHAANSALAALDQHIEERRRQSGGEPR
jgi:two-component system sensor histidine kinase RpfC